MRVYCSCAPWRWSVSFSFVGLHRPFVHPPTYINPATLAISITRLRIFLLFARTMIVFSLSRSSFILSENLSANTKHWTNVGLLLDQRRRRGPTLSQHWFNVSCLLWDYHEQVGGGPRVVVSTAAFHARVRGSVPGLGGLKETKLFLPHPRVKVSIVGSLRDREVACSASDRQG